MNQDTTDFLEELKQRPDVQGILLFGSWARGNNRPDSDVDLVVILREGFRRAVEYRNRQVFEIIYTTETKALDYWNRHKDDAAGLWEVARTLFDRDGSIQRLQARAKELLDAGKAPIDEPQLEHARFNAEDQLKYVENTLTNDPITANLILTNNVSALTELFFDIRQIWIPAPKQRLSKIEEISPPFHSLLRDFYGNELSLNEKLERARRMVRIVFA